MAMGKFIVSPISSIGCFIKSSSSSRTQLNISKDDDTFPLKSRMTCKICNFSGNSKEEYYIHLKQCQNSQAGKLLSCNQGSFAAHHRQHFEYHVRNHLRLKPFKCDKCNYICNNKEMLHSHMKKHSNVYPFQCSSCLYKTKYSCSMKKHLKKHNHVQSQSLHPDRLSNTNIVIDVNGRRWSPESKKKKPFDSATKPASISALALTRPSTNFLENSPLQPLNSFTYSSQILASFAGSQKRNQQHFIPEVSSKAHLTERYKRNPVCSSNPTHSNFAGNLFLPTYSIMFQTRISSNKLIAALTGLSIKTENSSQHIKYPDRLRNIINYNFGISKESETSASCSEKRKCDTEPLDLTYNYSKLMMKKWGRETELEMDKKNQLVPLDLTRNSSALTLKNIQGSYNKEL